MNLFVMAFAAAIVAGTGLVRAQTRGVPSTSDFGDGATTRAAATAAARQITVAVAADGKCSIVVSDRPPPTRRPTTGPARSPAPSTNPTPTRIAGLARASVDRDGDRLTVAYDFRDPDAADDFESVQATHVAGGLVVKPNTKNSAGAMFPSMRFPREVRAPFSVSVWPSEGEEAGVNCYWAATNGEQVTLQVSIEDGAVAVNRILGGDLSKRRRVTSPLSDGRPTKVDFLIGGSEAPRTGVPATVFAFGQPTREMRLRAFALEGALVGKFGVMFAKETATVEAVTDGPAQRAGVEVGDVMVAIDSDRTPTTAAALAALRRKNPGEQTVWTVRRDGKSVRVHLVAD